MQRQSTVCAARRGSSPPRFEGVINKNSAFHTPHRHTPSVTLIRVGEFNTLSRVYMYKLDSKPFGPELFEYTVL